MRSIFVFFFLHLFGFVLAQDGKVWIPDNGDGTYTNPIIHADYSDPDACRVGDDFYMTSSSFNAIPGLPILHSKDLVNWTIINHALKPNVDKYFDVVQHGNGVWAPSIRYHKGIFYIYWGDPDRGVFMVQSNDPKGEWSQPVLVKKAYGNIDPCPLWDDDGKVYMVHAFAHSRAGINSTLQVVELSADGSKILDKGRIVFDGHEHHPTIEGPKFYKRNGFYYIFAPAGGVPTGWQTVLRSKNIYGPYEDRIVLAQGQTEINGPHQGALIELENGESWFLHFQDKEAYGRVVHMQPVTWIDDWPVIGLDYDRDNIGEPILKFTKPKFRNSVGVQVPQTTDEFDDAKLRLQWQWQANPSNDWYTFESGKLWLQAIKQHTYHVNRWNLPSMLTQKLPAEEFQVTLKLDLSQMKPSDESGFMLFGLDYAGLRVRKDRQSVLIEQVKCLNAEDGASELTYGLKTIDRASELYFRIVVWDAKANFLVSSDGINFEQIGERFEIKEGKWVGAKLALYCSRLGVKGKAGRIGYDWIRFSKIDE
jgi:beta-xylosidase